MTTACLGIDTSWYTTSTALCFAQDGVGEEAFFQERLGLNTSAGERGLRQEEAVFQHVIRLPELLERLLVAHPGTRISAVCASVRPRPAEGAYMPVFRVGEGTGRAVAAALQVPFLPTSHQQGHLRAARLGTALKADAPHLAIHLSGGTTEVLKARGTNVTLLGGTADLHAGQLIDRVGVALGLAFPAGPALEALAAWGTNSLMLPCALRGLVCHFSGAETQALAWVRAGDVQPAEIAAAVFGCVSRTVARLICRASEQTGLPNVLLGGGVASSQWIRQDVTDRVAKRNNTVQLHWARPDLAGDNAVGTGMIGLDTMATRQGEDGHGGTGN